MAALTAPSRNEGDGTPVEVQIRRANASESGKSYIIVIKKNKETKEVILTILSKAILIIIGKCLGS